jgi:hypothetical protein
MAFRILARIIALALFLAYFAPVALKLKDIPLIVVLAGALILVLVDLYQSLDDR